MRVQNINNQQNNLQFKGLKIKITGLYKDYPKEAEEIINKVAELPKFKEFCKKFDVKMTIDSVPVYLCNNIESTLNLSYKLIPESKIKKILYKFFVGKDNISLFGLSKIHTSDTEAKFIDSSCRLKSKILDSLSSEMNVAITYTKTWAEKRALRKVERKLERTYDSRSDKVFNDDSAQLANRIKKLTKQF